MRTGKELILATKEYAKDNTAKSWWAVLSTTLLILLVAGGTLYNIHWIAQFACSILLGLLMVRLFVIYHDHQHNAILTKSKAAKVFMQAWGIIAITPTSIWTHSHNHHHNHNSKLRSAHIGSYPVMTKERYLRASRKERIQYLAMRHPLTILFGYFSIFLVGMCIVPALTDTKDHKDSALSLILHIALYAFVVTTFGWATALFAIFIPYFIACAMGSYLFYAQHNFPTVVFKENNGWTYEGAALESSSFCKMSPIMHYFTGNIGYHHIHHLNSKIPFYRLPEVYSKMPELQDAKTTTLNPIEVLRCLHLKVWDGDKQKLVPLKELAA
ncbi:MAG: fatty acid desaturase [Opitutales bacterium]|jgi:acyl-lipid omega-6 desaturase (Delta-12 desaturase)|nr:fatty acid desaturase [Opitutales bacterium]MDP4644480.1 fatty acid desaturase [Opitutales bacterium]MDP4777266.1 fatty acid desaturase [Opitutales bacterium]MDP4880215.1 fatty acid desaturase [Opitutales bacterium]MDP4883490.1 fatty acid desaturase [Opitutales bacterium]